MTRWLPNMLPKTFKAMETWDGKELPPEEVFEAFYIDFRKLVEEKREGKLSTQLNYTKNGFKSIIKKLRRKSKSFEEGNYKEQIMAVHKRWANVEYWQAIQRRAPAYTAQKYLKGMDMYKNESGEIVSVAEDRRIHRVLWLRTLEIAFFVTLFCFLMAYPIAHLLATLPMKYSNLLMICVLLPFWTSLLVRTASWMILLQQQGMVNDFFVWIGLVGDDSRPEMMFNKTGSYVAMTQILLPFMVLPLYSVMKTISPSLDESWKIFRWNTISSFLEGLFSINNTWYWSWLFVGFHISYRLLHYTCLSWRSLWNINK